MNADACRHYSKSRGRKDLYIEESTSCYIISTVLADKCKMTDSNLTQSHTCEDDGRQVDDLVFVDRNMKIFHLNL